MVLYSFSDLCSKDFQLKYFAAAQTQKNPYRHYVCVKSMDNCDRFFYIKKGEFHIKQEGYEELVAKEGDMLYLPGDCVYTSEWKSEEIEYLSVRFQLGDSNEDFSFSDKINIQLHDKNGTVRDILTSIVSIWTADEVGYKIKAYSLFFELLHYVSTKSFKSEIKHTQSDISKAILYIENNYIGEFSVTDLAKMCGMCESKLRKHFHEYAGMPPVSYRNYLRVKKAAELIQSGDYNVGEAAELTGFSDAAYFNRIFKTFMGENPGAYKKKTQNFSKI
ncbi:MAG: helix-turn-helix transcriptional regulator [Clostridia bacterium]|nr:helix-turn-helix transcriptional regulator [Clostridia bacterium]